MSVKDFPRDHAGWGHAPEVEEAMAAKFPPHTFRAYSARVGDETWVVSFAKDALLDNDTYKAEALLSSTVGSYRAHPDAPVEYLNLLQSVALLTCALKGRS